MQPRADSDTNINGVAVYPTGGVNSYFVILIVSETILMAVLTTNIKFQDSTHSLSVLLCHIEELDVIRLKLILRTAQQRVTRRVES